MYPRAPAGHRRHDIVRLLSGSVYLCVHVGMCVCVCEEVQGRKQELDA